MAQTGVNLNISKYAYCMVINEKTISDALIKSIVYGIHNYNLCRKEVPFHLGASAESYTYNYLLHLQY